MAAVALLMVNINGVSAGLGRTFWKTRDKILHDYAHHQHHKNVKLLVKLANVTTNFIEQPLDHFDLEDGKTPMTYQQRYYVNEEYWKKPDGPVFIFIGGEGELSPYNMMEGHTVEMAQNFGALLFGVEHRFYGESINKDGLKMDQMQYLNSQQALADLAAFHGFASNKYQLTSKNTWVCFGGSYPGALSAWFRLKYPHLVYASVASSAPVRAQVNFEGYNEVVVASLGNPIVGGSKECTGNISAAFQTINTKEHKALEKDFNTCDSIAAENDYKTFIMNLAGPFQGTVQYNSITNGKNTIDWVCRNMTKSADPYQNLVDFITQTDPRECFDVSYEEFVNDLKNTSAVSGGIGFRQWTYQTCQQFGYYQTCDKNTTCFFLPQIDLAYDLQLCQDVYGFKQNDVFKHIDFTNLYYGADKPDGARILFVNGDIDPWHALGVIESLSQDEVAVFIKGASHCQDMQSSRDYDSVDLINGRKMIEGQLARWLLQAKAK